MNTKNLEELIAENPHVINIGVFDFAASLENREPQVIHVYWTPPAGGHDEASELARKLL